MFMSSMGTFWCLSYMHEMCFNYESWSWLIIKFSTIKLHQVQIKSPASERVKIEKSINSTE